MFSALLGLAGCGLLKGGSEEEKKGFGQECAKDTDCGSAECAAYGSICTKGCTYDRECGEGLVCRAKDTGTGMQCSKPAGSKVGATCRTATECDHGFCLKKANAPDDPGFCSSTCQGPGDCPDGYKLCDSISDSGSTKMCIIGDDKIPIGERPQFTAPRPVVGTTTPKPQTTTTAPPDAGVPTPTATNTIPPPDAGAPKPDAGTTAPPDAGTTAPTGADAGVRPRIKLDLGKKK